MLEGDELNARVIKVIREIRDEALAKDATIDPTAFEKFHAFFEAFAQVKTPSSVLRGDKSLNDVIRVLECYTLWEAAKAKARCADLDAQIKALVSKIEALEGTGTLKYVGVWSDDNRYERGNVATHNGSMWHCNVGNTAARPGDGTKDWTLCVKSGRDAKGVGR